MIETDTERKVWRENIEKDMQRVHALLASNPNITPRDLAQNKREQDAKIDALEEQLFGTREVAKKEQPFGTQEVKKWWQFWK
jgi:hypothetical protein